MDLFFILPSGICGVGYAKFFILRPRLVVGFRVNVFSFIRVVLPKLHTFYS